MEQAFIEGDRVRIKKETHIAPKFRGRLGVVTRWHHDIVYTVYIVGMDASCIFLASEMEKTND